MKQWPAAAATVGLALVLGVGAAEARNDIARNACDARVRMEGGPNARDGLIVMQQEDTAAGTVVILRDAMGTQWRCVAEANGTVTEVGVDNAPASDDDMVPDAEME